MSLQLVFVPLAWLRWFTKKRRVLQFWVLGLLLLSFLCFSFIIFRHPFAKFYSLILPFPHDMNIEKALKSLGTSNDTRTCIFSITVGTRVGYRLLNASQPMQRFLLTGDFTHYNSSPTSSSNKLNMNKNSPIDCNSIEAKEKAERIGRSFSCCNASGLCISVVVYPVIPPVAMQQCGRGQSTRMNLDPILRQLNCISALHHRPDYTWLAAYRCAIPTHLYKYPTVFVIFTLSIVTSLATFAQIWPHDELNIPRLTLFFFYCFKYLSTVIGTLLPLVLSALPNLLEYRQTYTSLWIAILTQVAFGGDDNEKTTITHELGAWSAILTSVVVTSFHFRVLFQEDVEYKSSVVGTHYGRYLRLLSALLILITLVIVLLRMWPRHASTEPLIQKKYYRNSNSDSDSGSLKEIRKRLMRKVAGDNQQGFLLNPLTAILSALALTTLLIGMLFCPSDDQVRAFEYIVPTYLSQSQSPLMGGVQNHENYIKTQLIDTTQWISIGRMHLVPLWLLFLQLAMAFFSSFAVAAVAMQNLNMNRKESYKGSCVLLVNVLYSSPVETETAKVYQWLGWLIKRLAFLLFFLLYWTLYGPYTFATRVRHSLHEFFINNLFFSWWKINVATMHAKP